MSRSAQHGGPVSSSSSPLFRAAFTESYQSYMMANTNSNGTQIFNSNSPTSPSSNQRNHHLSSGSSSGSVLKPSGSNNITTAVTAEERAEFREIFDLVDEDKGGTISRDELKKLMATLRLQPTDEDINDMMREVNAERAMEEDFDINFEEFVRVMSTTTPFSVPSSKLRSAFKMFEFDDKEGFCSTELLKDAILHHCADELAGDYELENLLSKLDPSRSGMLKMDDFFAIFLQTELAVENARQEQLMRQQQSLQLHQHAVSFKQRSGRGDQQQQQQQREVFFNDDDE